jgi:hypothetical protein
MLLTMLRKLGCIKVSNLHLASEATALSHGGLTRGQNNASEVIFELSAFVVCSARLMDGAAEIVVLGNMKYRNSK